MVLVQISNNCQSISVSDHNLEELVKAICRRFGLSKATISIAIVDDAQMRKLNCRFLGRDASTDCLSFDLSDGGHSKSTCPVRESPVRGSQAGGLSSHGARSFELVVNGELALKEAHLRGHSSEAELALYVTHGMLHNLGFNDSTQKRAKKMHAAEDEILQQFGYGAVYSKKARC